MPQSDIGVGGLPLPQFSYPFQFAGPAPYAVGTNKLSLLPAQAYYLPRGTWFVAVTGSVSALQFLDPVRQEWANLLGPGAAWALRIQSDGGNYRVINLSDAAYGGLVTAAGSGYAQASTTVTPSTGNSTWTPIVGGALGAFTVNTGLGMFAGSGFSMPPLVIIPEPPSPGIPATATAALTAGAVSAVTIRTAGAGYTSAPPIYLAPNPTDPAFLAGNVNLPTPNPGLVTVALTGAGTVTGVLLTNFGQALTTAPTLTIGGVGSGATATTNPATVVAAANDVLTIQPA